MIDALGIPRDSKKGMIGTQGSLGIPFEKACSGSQESEGMIGAMESSSRLIPFTECRLNWKLQRLLKHNVSKFPP